MSNRKKINAAISALLTRENEDALSSLNMLRRANLSNSLAPLMECYVGPAIGDAVRRRISRAVEYFKALGIDVSEYDAFELQGDRVVGKSITFNQDFRSVPEATQAVLDIFDQVYGFAQRLRNLDHGKLNAGATRLKHQPRRCNSLNTTPFS